MLHSRLVNNKEELFVHYRGWDKKFDEWRAADKILSIPEEFVNGDILTFFKSQLLMSVKESLTSVRKTNSEVTLHIAVQRKVFQEFAASCGLKTDSKSRRGYLIYRFPIPSVGKLAFPQNSWWYRIMNSAGDFAAINFETLQFWLDERIPLKDFTETGEEIFIHRGFQAVIRFVEIEGNRDDIKFMVKA